MTNKKPIKFIFATVVLDMLGIGIIIPVLPDVIRRFTSDASSINHLFGYFVALYALMQFFASPILGGLSDRFGRRPVLLASLLGASADYIFMAFAPTLPLLFLGRIISGLTGASMTVANSYIADISDDSNRSSNFGLIGAAFGIGFIAGPLLGGLFGHINPVAPFITAAILNFLNFLFGIFILPESLSASQRRLFEKKSLNPFLSISKILKPSPILVFVTVYGLLFLAGNVHPSIWTIYTEHKFGWTSLQVGLSLGVVGLVYGFSQAVLTKKLVPIWGEHKSLKIGIIFNLIGFLFYAFSPFGWMMYVTMFLSCLSGLAMPCLQSAMTKQTDVDRQGELQGGLASISSLAAIAAPLLYTISFDWALSSKSGPYSLGLPYVIAAGIVAICWILILRRPSSESVLKIKSLN